METTTERRLQQLRQNLDEDIFVQCPTCETKLRRYEVAEHCEQEMERLKKLKANSLIESEDLGKKGENEGEGSYSNIADVERRRKPWSVFQRVQRNRQTRMKLRSRKRPSTAEYPCPMCNVSFPENEIQPHAEACLRRNNSNEVNGRRDRDSNDEHSSNDEDVGEEYEEYEWAGQKRIRVSSLLPGGYAAIGIGQAVTNGTTSGSAHHQDDEDEDLNVDEDDTQIYGPTQYGENDVIAPVVSLENGESDVTSYMRKLITGSSANKTEHNKNDTTFISLDNSEESLASTSSTAVIVDATSPAHYQQIIDSLKFKLRQYENHVSSKYKCLICLDDYRNPAISVSCWHVHCEQCWLRSLGARKLCPQCNLITTPKDLRRIYM
uniref:RING-type domain-containing protein n=1 Tax=Glossina morsitans morsitans TaxID=37546 RepID=A0A1B0G7Y4_GLOMM